jgi:hypothetical protein
MADRVDKLLALIDQRDWAAIAGEMTPDLEEAFRSAGKESLQTYRVRNASFDLVDKRAVAYAQQRSARLVKMLSDATREQLRTTIKNAIEQGWSAGRLRSELVDNQAFSAERGLKIARTEIKQAREAANYEAAQTAEAKQKIWHADANACPLCAGNAAAGEIPIDQDFPSGDSYPGAHPNCSCDVEYL